MTWMQRLKRVFSIDIETCPKCGGKLRVYRRALKPDRITTLFTEDGIWEAKSIGEAKGHAEIRKLFQRFQKSIRFSQHMTMNPVIEVEAETARGAWYFFGPFTMEKDNQALWQACRYHESYRKVEGEWLIERLTVKGPRMAVDYETGWAR